MPTDCTGGPNLRWLRMYSRAFMSGIQYIMNNNRKKAKQLSIQGKKVKMASLARSVTVRNRPPRIRLTNGPGGRQNYTVDHREYVQDINGSVGFAVTKFSINPGLTSLFPWLCPIARQYETYIVNRMQYEFETQRASTVDGRVMLFVDYDASDTTPVNKGQLLNEASAVSSPVRESCVHTSLVHNLHKFSKEKFVRSGTIDDNTDIKTVDVGNLFVATQGCADTSAVGELYIDYSITFSTTNSDFQNLIRASSKYVLPATSITRTAPFGTAPVLTGGIDITAASATLTFNEIGQYLISAHVGGTVIADVNPALGGTATSKIAVTLYASAAATAGEFTMQVSVSERGQTVTYDFTGVATTITSGRWYISKYLYSLG